MSNNFRNLHHYTRLYLMKNGRIVEQGNPLDLVANKESFLYDTLVKDDIRTVRRLENQILKNRRRFEKFLNKNLFKIREKQLVDILTKSGVNLDLSDMEYRVLSPRRKKEINKPVSHEMVDSVFNQLTPRVEAPQKFGNELITPQKKNEIKQSLYDLRRSMLFSDSETEESPENYRVQDKRPIQEMSIIINNGRTEHKKFNFGVQESQLISPTPNFGVIQMRGSSDVKNKALRQRLANSFNNAMSDESDSSEGSKDFGKGIQMSQQIDENESIDTIMNKTIDQDGQAVPGRRNVFERAFFQYLKSKRMNSILFSKKEDQGDEENDGKEETAVQKKQKNINEFDIGGDSHFENGLKQDKELNNMAEIHEVDMDYVTDSKDFGEEINRELR